MTAAPITPRCPGRTGTGCSQLELQPEPLREADDRPDRRGRRASTSNLTVPQPLSPTVPSPSELRAATVTLPPGFSINPNAADGKVACADDQANFGSSDRRRTARSSPRSASLEIDSSALPGPLPGFVYLGQPLPGNRYRHLPRPPTASPPI